ncbi:hypothetical protein AAMO2058_000805200 [Amorphochlora amoebiformis]
MQAFEQRSWVSLGIRAAASVAAGLACVSIWGGKKAQTVGKKFYIFGHPVSKSPSPLMHNTGFKACNLPHHYTAVDSVDVKMIEKLVKAKDFGGASVTIPLKEKLFHIVDQKSESVEKIGALNTLIPKDGKILADNTDWKGILYPLQPLVKNVVSTTAVVLGAGGTSRAAIFALRKLGYQPSKLVVLNPRTPAKAEALAKEFGCTAVKEIESIKDISLVVSTLPAKATYMVSQSVFDQKPVIFQACYLPPETPLSIAAVANGCKLVRGLDMLIAQGVEQFELWTGVPKEKVVDNILIGEGVHMLNASRLMLKGGKAFPLSPSLSWEAGLRRRNHPRVFSSGEWPRHDHVPMYLVDAFTRGPFCGNPAAICLLPDDVKATSRWMQNVAMEMNQAETAFISPLTRSNTFSLRWFTPVAEVDLCGHATLASAKVLYAEGYVSPEAKISFETRSGTLTTDMQPGEKDSNRIAMTFPKEPVTKITDETEIQRVKNTLTSSGLGLDAVEWIGETKFDYFICLSSDPDVRNFNPDMTSIADLGKRGSIITAQSDRPDEDYVTRFFAPQLGIPEDPVTGSAHCALGPYWCEVLNKGNLVGYQASKRGGRVLVENMEENVQLKGGAIITLKGELNVLVL